MSTSRRSLALIPDALLVEGHEILPGSLIVHARARGADGRCPLCGTVICDLQCRRIVDLLPNREPATVEAWHAEHQGIEIIARDRSGGYSKAAPDGRATAQAASVMLIN